MTIWAAVITAFGGSFVGSAVVALLSQRWIERRERRIRRDQMCLDLYLNVIELILENEHQLALRTPDGGIPPADIQLKRYGISHRLKLLASEPVIKAYSNYSKLVFRETTAPIAQRPSNPDAVVESREALIDEMAKHLREGLGRNEPSKIAAFFVAKQPV
jgi:hypothetical protein